MWLTRMDRASCALCRRTAATGLSLAIRGTSARRSRPGLHRGCGVDRHPGRGGVQRPQQLCTATPSARWTSSARSTMDRLAFEVVDEVLAVAQAPSVTVHADHLQGASGECGGRHVGHKPSCCRTCWRADAPGNRIHQRRRGWLPQQHTTFPFLARALCCRSCGLLYTGARPAPRPQARSSIELSFSFSSKPETTMRTRRSLLIAGAL